MKKFLEDPSLGLVRSKRPPQIAMHDAVVQVLREGGVGFSQAPTGVGKSLAYLTALRAALEDKLITRAVVATAKKTLQTQLFGKDLPALAKLAPFRFASLKGRANYVCKLRFAEFLADDGAVYEHRDFGLAAFSKWVETDPVGDLASFPAEVPFEWRVRVGDCAGLDCPHFRDCGFIANRFYARDRAQVVVVNHTLLALDLQYDRGRLLGPYDALVVDEAHQLDSFARKAYAAEIFERQSVQIEHALQHDFRVKVPGKLRSVYAAVFDAVGRLDAGPLRHRDAVLPPLRALAEPLDELAKQLTAAGARSGGTAEDVPEGGGGDEAPRGPAGARANARLDAVARQIDQIRRCVALVEENRDDWLIAVERPDPRAAPRLTATPLEVGHVFGPKFKEIGKVHLASATLATTDGFGYVRRLLGVPKDLVRVEQVLPSPFDYKSRSGMWVPDDARWDPKDRRGTTEYYVAKCHEICAASGGGAFVLCASREDMRNVAAGLARAAGGAYNVLVQGDNVDRDIAAFSAGYDNVLVGVKSIWEGVDVPGLRLRVVVILRIPFPSPDDHLHAARKDLRRMALANDPDVDYNERKIDMKLFHEYDVQQAAIEMAQGGGRLIRTETDFGMLIFLDPRMHRGAKPYTGGLRALFPHPPFKDQKDVYEALAIFRDLARQEEASGRYTPKL